MYLTPRRVLKVRHRTLHNVAQKTLIGETQHVIAIEQDLGGDNVVVTFNPIGQFRAGLRFWGDNFLRKAGISAIGIVTLGPNWYPLGEMEQLLVPIRERTKGRLVVTYGHGQGGYGALKFAARLKASATLSFSPQWSINPAEVASFDTRFSRYFTQAIGSGLSIEQEDLSDRSFVLFNKKAKSDAKHAAKLAALSGVMTIVTPFSVDDTIRIITQGRGAAKFISLCASATPPLGTELRQEIRAARMQSTVYLESVLRQLILRMYKSRARSSAFVSALIGKSNDDNRFQSALIAHSKGDANLALLELERSTAKDFDNIDLLSWRTLARKVRFAKAELAVAGQIIGRDPGNTFSCLQAADTLIEAGDHEGAHRELLRLAKHADAADRVALFIELSEKLRAPEVLETFLSNALPESGRIHILFLLVDLYQRLNDRKSAFRNLMALAMTCANSPADLRKVADYSVKLNEIVFALDIRERLLRDAPGDYLLALDVVDARIWSNKVRALSELKEIMGRTDLPSTAWERASRLYERLGKPDAALRAIAQAVALPGPRSGARRRFAALLEKKGKTRRARRELGAFLADGSTDAGQLRAAADLAIILKDQRLALKFAEAQFQHSPTNPAAILYLARHLQAIGDRNRASGLLSSLLHAEQRAPSMLNEQWLSLAQGLYDVGDIALSKEALGEAVARDPRSSVARKLAATIALLEKYRNA